MFPRSLLQFSKSFTSFHRALHSNFPSFLLPSQSFLNQLTPTPQGNVTFNLKIQDPPYPDIALGLGIIHNLTLAPGNNTVPFLGHLDFRTLLTQLQRILRAEAQSLQEGVLTLWINGNSTIYHGQHIPYYETILQGLVLPTTIPIQQLLVGTLGGTLNNSAGTLQNIVQALNLTALAPPNEVSRAMEIVQARMDENLRVR